MRKKVTYEDSYSEYYCDLCEKKVRDDEFLEKCRLCSNEACYECREEVPTVDCNVFEFVLCKTCAERNRATINAMQANIDSFNVIDEDLRGMLY